MRSFENKSTEEHLRPTARWRTETDAIQSGNIKKLNPGRATSCHMVLSGFSKYSGSIASRSILQLQQRCGNQCAQQVIKLSKKTDNKSEVVPDVESAIETARGSGYPLDSNTRSKMGSALNAEFGNVRVHTDTRADSLNRALNAKAFTTGQDIFFRQGEYNPGSSSGKELLAHELTHVVQQVGSKIQTRDENETATSNCTTHNLGLSQCMQAKLSVSSPGDIHEKEADRMAQAYIKLEQRGPLSVESGRGLHRQAVDDENKEDQKPLMAQLKGAEVLRQPEAESEKEKEKGLVQGNFQKGGIQRQTAQEEEGIE